MSNHRLSCFFYAGVLLVFGNLTGCALIADFWQQDALAAQGEAVFRRQNEMTSQVMLLSETELSESELQKLQQTEARMQQDCHLLNEYARREMEDESMDLAFQNQVKNSISACEASIQKIEATLTELGIHP
jgi:hypothetical protein